MISKNLVAATFFSLFTGLTNTQSFAADTKPCSLQDALLVCGEPKAKGAGILDAMAHPGTLTLLQTARNGPLVYPDGYVREDYRRSLEKNRNAAKRFADKAFRQYKRRRMSPEEYEEVRGKFEAAMLAYNAGMLLYREGTWRSSVSRKN